MKVTKMNLLITNLFLLFFVTYALFLFNLSLDDVIILEGNAMKSETLDCLNFILRKKQSAYHSFDVVTPA